MLINGKNTTAAQYISNTTPIPQNQPKIAAATALAGEQLGLKCTYLDAGSKAESPINSSTIELVSNLLETPLIVGGGIKSAEQAENAWKAGAQIVVVGTAFEKEPDILNSLLKAKLNLQ